MANAKVCDRCGRLIPQSRCRKITYDDCSYQHSWHDAKVYELCPDCANKCIRFIEGKDLSKSSSALRGTKYDIAVIDELRGE